ncbi:MAG TPA: GNAT family N-acetyltransferase [Gaiellaceae bacterium]|nr:GNAT family N-acetyltransferase [Gaiellaceae bacterium]
MNVRPFGEEDFPAIARLLEEDELTYGHPTEIGVNELGEWTGTTDLANDSWLFEDGDGAAAVGWVFPRDDLGTAIGAVHPRAKGRGLGAELVDRSEAALRRHGAARIHQITLGGDMAADELMRGRGYMRVRSFYEMAIQLDAAPDPVAGVAIDPFSEADAQAFYDALEEAFHDHWEHHTTSFEEWWERQRSKPNYDPSLWYLVRDGAEIAAVARSEAGRNGGGYVGHVGVRRPWRGRGYAKALLLHTFRVFYERGLPRVTLGVDAENPTGATHLYERVGMHVESENVVYEKVCA